LHKKGGQQALEQEGMPTGSCITVEASRLLNKKEGQQALEQEDRPTGS